MADPLEKFFDPQRLNQYWSQYKPPRAPVAQEQGTPGMRAFMHLQKLITSELPGQTLLFQPLLEQARQLLVEQDKGELTKANLAKNQAALRKVLEDVEDFLDVFLLTKPK